MFTEPVEGPPPMKWKGKKKITEQALPEPRLIKTRLIDVRDSFSALVADRYYTAMQGKDTKRYDLRFQREVINLFEKLSNKDELKDMAGDLYRIFHTKILYCIPFTFKEVYVMSLILGDVMQTLGITKIEYLRSVPPEMAVLEEDMLGED
jgi:hypothetical protein